MFQSVKEMSDAVKPAATVLSDRVSVTECRRAHRRRDRSPGVDGVVWRRRRAAGHRALDHPVAGRGRRGSARVDPRSVSGDGARCDRRLHRAGHQRPRHDLRHGARRDSCRDERSKAGAFIFEIARSEIGYTEQRPHEYAAIVLAAALREGLQRVRCSSRATTSRRTPRNTTAPTATRSSTILRALIKEEIAAGFYNIDIDTSTLVDLDKPTLDEQQEVNVTLAADFAAFIRAHEPHGVTVSVGGEIGEVGGKNSDVHELHAYMKGFNRKLKERGADLVGLSKISVQTGTAHGGFVNADGRVRHGREDRPDDARRAVAPGADGLRPGRRRAARRVDAAAGGLRCVPARRRLRNPPGHRLPEHGLRAPAVPGRPQGRDVRVDSRERDRRAEAQRTPRSSSSTRRARRPSVRSSAACGASDEPRRRPSASRSRSGSRS